jgi:hypothetical protein
LFLVHVCHFQKCHGENLHAWRTPPWLLDRIIQETREANCDLIKNSERL